MVKWLYDTFVWCIMRGQSFETNHGILYTIYLGAIIRDHKITQKIGVPGGNIPE